MLPTRRKSIKTLETPLTMPSKLEHPGKSPVISPVLFLTVEGEPMRFFLCPGPAKVELLPCIREGGGLVCRAQEPGAVLLVDPRDKVSLTGNAAHRYVSVQYIRDCVEKNEQLELDDYRMKPHDATDARSTRRSTASSSPSSKSAGRIPYTSEEDAAIISYVSLRKDRLKGNMLWQEMEAIQVTAHTWQSMKYRYLQKLMDRPSEERAPQTTNRPITNRQTTHPLGAGSPESTNVMAPTAGSPHVPDVTPQEEEEEDVEEDEDVDIEVEEELEKDMKGEEEKEVEEDMEEEEEEVDVGATASTQAVLAESPRHNSCPRMADQSPKMHISLRRRLRLMILPETPLSGPLSSKKARTSSSHSPARASTSAAATKSAGAKKSAAATLSAAAPSSRGPSPPRTPRQPIEGSQSAAGQVTQEEAEKGGKRKEKRKLGILEKATKEFEDDSESDDEASADPPRITNTQHPRRTPSKQTPDEPMESRTAMETGSAPKPHLFIFESETPEQGSQAMDSEDAALPAPGKKVEKSKHLDVEQLNKTQLKKDMERITELMKQTDQDLVKVTLALLNTSGDFTAASALLLHPDSGRGPVWTPRDDQLLLTSDPDVHRQLRKTYGELGVARRLAFLDSL